VGYSYSEANAAIMLHQWSALKQQGIAATSKATLQLALQLVAVLLLKYFVTCAVKISTLPLHCTRYYNKAGVKSSKIYSTTAIRSQAALSVLEKRNI
jgi:hypothetical protein